MSGDGIKCHCKSNPYHFVKKNLNLQIINKYVFRRAEVLNAVYVRKSSGLIRRVVSFFKEEAIGSDMVVSLPSEISVSSHLTIECRIPEATLLQLLHCLWFGFSYSTRRLGHTYPFEIYNVGI
jgi:hypothetical protein